ncbi:hypothetical protein QJS10_CPA10g00201 [Acorus calamus]|uniref:Uncharacterized protein n=1 Tax=Acorus calamus TaxID=4465 RepID=A0AAV9DWQ6_ACOCL|nr:hypothetical protein QJS10_CPA10g00201 [Acorus calamus]
MPPFMPVMLSKLMEGEPPSQPAAPPDSHSTWSSIETLMVVLAAITILGALAGMLARACGGRRMVDSGGYDDAEGWVERACKSCIDGGVAAVAPPQMEVKGTAADGVGEVKK